MFYLDQVKECDFEAGKILEEYNKKSNKDYRDNHPIKPSQQTTHKTSP